MNIFAYLALSVSCICAIRAQNFADKNYFPDFPSYRPNYGQGFIGFNRYQSNGFNFYPQPHPLFPLAFSGLPFGNNIFSQVPAFPESRSLSPASKEINLKGNLVEKAIEIDKQAQVIPSSEIAKSVPRPSKGSPHETVGDKPDTLDLESVPEISQNVTVQSPSILNISELEMKPELEPEPIVKYESQQEIDLTSEIQNDFALQESGPTDAFLEKSSEFVIPKEAIVDDIQISQENLEDHPCRAPPRRGRLSCSGVETNNSGLRWYHSETDFRCYTFIYTGCGGNSNNYATKEACQQKCFVADGPSCSPGGRRFDEHGEHCGVLKCPKGSVCRMGAFFASCCDQQMEEYSSASYADTCPNGANALADLISKSCLDLICPNGYQCSQINPIYARCCSSNHISANVQSTHTPQSQRTPRTELNLEVDCKPDSHPYCRHWSLTDECDSNPLYMHYYCKNACKLCKQSDHVIIL